MAAALEHLDERWGGSAGYLVEACGLRPRELTRVRAWLVEPSAG